jgi:hypothetical protein
MLAALFAAATARAEDRPAATAKTSTAQPTFAKDVAPLLAEYCVKCHGGRRPRAGLVLDRFKDEASAVKERKLWEKVGQYVQAGEMPPAGRKKPPPAELAAFNRWNNGLLTPDCVKDHDPGRITVRRLNRAEYNNTIRDLVGVAFKPADDFPTDDVGYGFDNIGDLMSVSPLLLEKYLAAAEKIVELAFKDSEGRRRIMVRNVSGKDDGPAVRAILENFARRAYRRPVSEDEVSRLITRFVEPAEKNGDGPIKGIQVAVQAVLVSPNFLFRIERDRRQRKGEPASYPISEYELASRLSYFLWSSMPDEELFRQAGLGTLRKNLDAQVKRMLADPKARALTENFAGQWLQIRNLQSMTPDPATFPTFDEELRQSMQHETELFFEAIIKEDRSILDFIDGDFTFVNERLARHYGIPGVKGSAFRRVHLPEDRGGLLTQASILTVTSNPTRTSPVKRGKWILDNILNTPPPPPPPNVPELANQKELTGSLRQRMEQHRANAICASCHQRMDPLGFGFENFDGIGAWRVEEGDIPIDPSGTLPGGQTFKGPRELRAVLKQKEAEFRLCLAEKLLTYALGRGLEFADKCAVKDIAEAVKRQDFRFSSLVIAIVRSEPFQKRKAVGGGA